MVKVKENGKRGKNRGCLIAILVCAALYVGFCIMIVSALGSLFSSGSTTVEKNSVYCLKMSGTVVEQAQEESPFAALTGKMPYYGRQEETKGLNDILSNIKLAKEDERIKGIYLKGGKLGVGPASAKAIRDALADFKESGKWIIAYAENYSQMNYYIASVADAVYLSPVGCVEWHGLGGTRGYYKRLLDKIGVEMQVLKVGTFKSAVEPYIRTSMSEADRKQTEIYLHGIWDNMTAAVSQSRGISVEKLNALADEMMDIAPEEAYVAGGLIDSLIYRQSVDTIIKGLMDGEKFHLLSHSAMNAVERDEPDGDDEIAVVYAEGEISDNDGNGIVADEMLKTLRKVQKNDDVKAMVFRVNSPGGSANASEEIWHAVKLIQEQGIPVVVSMGDYAASGGYYISCEADYIFAEPTTLTGSIGIFGLIPNWSKLRDKIGYDIDCIGTNKHSAMNSTMVAKGMDESERAMMQAMIERGYDLFTKRCAEGRKMAQDDIKAIGEGRVWLGQDAVKLGLVDALGNINDAIAKAAELAGLEDYSLTYYPAKKDPLEEFLKMLDNSTDEEKLIAKLKQLVKEPRVMMLAPVVEIR